MDKELLFVVVVFWLTCTAYVLYYFNKHHKVNFETVCFAILLGPIISLIMKDPEEEKYHYNYREHIPDFRHTTAPPPPISRVERAIRERDGAIMSARERLNLGEVRGEWRRQNGINNLKDFKFFRG